MQKHPIATMIGGGILAAWIPFWTLVSTLSTFDFMRTASGHPSIGTFFLPSGLSNGVIVLGIFVMVFAFVRLARAGIPPDDRRAPTYPDLRFDLQSAREELGRVRSELNQARNRVTELSRELEATHPQVEELRRMKDAEAKAAGESMRRAELLDHAPQLWVTYKQSGEHEILTFSKDGSPIKSLEVGELVWNIDVRRPISLFNVIGPIRDDPVECRFTPFERHGNAQVLHSLPDLLREIVRKHDTDAQPSLCIRYQDFEGHRFMRTFVLAMDVYGRVVLNPGSVELQT